VRPRRIQIARFGARAGRRVGVGNPARDRSKKLRQHMATRGGSEPPTGLPAWYTRPIKKDRKRMQRSGSGEKLGCLRAFSWFGLDRDL